MVVDHGSARDILCIAGGTGFAPIKAIIEGLAAQPGGGRPGGSGCSSGPAAGPDLYDLPDLARLESACALLDVVTALSDEPGRLAACTAWCPTWCGSQAAGRTATCSSAARRSWSGPRCGSLAHRASGEHLYCDPLRRRRGRVAPD